MSRLMKPSPSWKGEYNQDPVKSDFGYHIIQLDDTRPLTPPSFEEVSCNCSSAPARCRWKTGARTA